MTRAADLRALTELYRAEWRSRTVALLEQGVPTGLHVNIGIDILSAATLQFANGFQGTSATATSASTFTTDANNIPLNSVVGQYVIATVGAIRFGIIQSNTSATNSVCTIDRWYDASALPANVNVAAASTPTTGAWMIPPGQVPAAYIGLSASGTAPAVTDTLLTSEINTAGASGLDRQLATYAHSAASGGAGTTTLVKTFTTAAADTIPVTVHQMAVFQGVVVAASRLMFRTVLNADATMAAIGDQLALTWTGTLS